MNLGRETETVEFKQTTGDLNNALKTVSAMLNKNGYGTIYFGVKNNGDVVGQQISDSTTRDISRYFYEKIKPAVYPNIEILSTEGKEYIKVSFSGIETPYSANEIFFIRVADEDRKISIEKLKDFFDFYNKDNSIWENTLTSETLEDLDVDSINQFNQDALASGRVNSYDIKQEDIIEKLGLAKNGFLNNAGKYLFSKNKPIKVKLAVFATDTQITFIDQNLVSGNVYQLIKIMQQYIENHINWESIISVGPRKEIPEIPREAIKEIVVNSLCHAKYNTNTTHEIAITPKKVSVYNPGNFPYGATPEDYVYRNLRSVTINPLIANTLYLSKNIESWGTGIKRVYDLCNKSNVKVSFENEKFGYNFIFHRSNLGVDLGVDLGVELSETETSIYSLIKSDNKITTIELAKRIFKTPQTVTNNLNKLKEKGYIKRVGSNRYGRWQILK